ncbi:MAG TPA: ATP-binding protein [Pseudomonadales bacterium]
MRPEREADAPARPPLSWQALHAVLEHAPFGIYVVDDELRFALINAAAQQHVFRNVAPAVGRDLAEAMRVIWPEEVASTIVAEFRRTLDTGRSYQSLEYVQTRADIGATESYEWELHRIELPEGRCGVACYFYESTKLVAGQKALRSSEKLQAFLLQFSDTLRVQPDEQSVCDFAMKLLVDVLHVDACHLVAIDVPADAATITHRLGGTDTSPLPLTVKLSDFPTPLQHSLERTFVCNDVDQDPALTTLDRESLAVHGVGALVSATVRRGDRHPIWAMSVSTRTPRMWTVAEIALVEDVAERTWSAIERARAERALRDADRRKDEFLAMLAHELRNPLAAISNAGHVLQRTECDTKTLRATADMLNRQVGHMVRQVDDLLDMSRISRGRIELRKECISLGKVASDALESTRALIEAAHHELNVTLPPTPLYVLGDPVRLAQVIGNLLNNAAKFTNRGGRIWLTVEQEGDEALVRVRDNGIGVPAGEHDRIFELFVQGEQPGQARGGLGLGLALVHQLVSLHGGTVSARSEDATPGSEFVVRLPLLTNLMPSNAEASSDPADAPPPRRRVLVVDDNRDSANSLATLLTLMGHDADTAHDGVEAVKKAVTFKADLILLDIGMPRLNGYEAVSWIREQGHKNLTIVALTGWGQEEDRRRSAESGFDAHVVKPIDVATLTKLLADAGSPDDAGGGGGDSGA